jgi:hypothetical protein
MGGAAVFINQAEDFTVVGCEFKDNDSNDVMVWQTHTVIKNSTFHNTKL